MRHALFGRKLSRTTKARQGLMKNLANSLFLHGNIETTEAKAKFARVFAEKLITLAKKNKLNNDRKLSSYLSHDAFIKLTQDIAPGLSQRSGGYTRIIKVTSRKGDNSKMAKLSIVDYQSSPKLKKETLKKVKHKTQKQTVDKITKITAGQPKKVTEAPSKIKKAKNK